MILDHKNREIIDKWLDPDFLDIDAFAELLIPEIRQTQRITPIGRPSQWNPIGESYLLK